MNSVFIVISLLWLGWIAYWIFAARDVKAVAETASWQSRALYSIPLLIAAVLLFDTHLGRFFNIRLVAHTAEVAWLGALLTAAGLAFAIWARVILGGNWSGQVTVKEGHELIRSGPYALARHPIYTGLVLALFGTALAVGEMRGLLALALAVGSFIYKMGIEEGAMRRTFGGAYDDYAREVRALIPFVV
jgi:protein-S-isoprenylcysteine O-methyltransferase Ste14